MNHTVTIIVAVVSALGTSGATGYFFKWLSDQPKNKAHENQAWNERQDKAILTAESRSERLQEDLLLAEYKLDRLIQNFDTLLGELQALGAPADRISRERSQIRVLRFMKEIPEAPQGDDHF